MNFLTPGYLTDLSKKVMSGVKLTNKEKLTTEQLEQISRIYGLLAKDHDLYDLLFKQPNQILEGINTSDLALFTYMDHAHSRGKYWKPIGTAPTDGGNVCHGVPLAFKGARTVFGKTYMSWFTNLEVARYIECDIFLPYGLNSLEIKDDGKAVLTDNAGLISLYLSDDIEWEAKDIRYLRDNLPNYAKYVMGSVPKDTKIGEVYCKCSILMRCLLAQGWCWTGGSRGPDMITDFRDWDNFVPSVDKVMTGLTPKNDLPLGATSFISSINKANWPPKAAIGQDDLKL
jgi:hypothetical protein